MGTRRRAGRTPSSARSTAWTQETTPDRGSPAHRNLAAARSDRRTLERKPAAKKGALVIRPQRRYSADEKAKILATIALAQARCSDQSIDVILGDLGLPKATYHRWTRRARQKRLADRVITPHLEAVPPTPAEVQCVRTFADAHFGLGYRRLAYSLMLENRAFPAIPQKSLGRIVRWEHFPGAHQILELGKGLFC